MQNGKLLAVACLWLLLAREGSWCFDHAGALSTADVQALQAHGEQGLW